MEERTCFYFPTLPYGVKDLYIFITSFNLILRKTTVVVTDFFYSVVVSSDPPPPCSKDILDIPSNERPLIFLSIKIRTKTGCLTTSYSVNLWDLKLKRSTLNSFGIYSCLSRLRTIFQNLPFTDSPFEHKRDSCFRNWPVDEARYKSHVKNTSRNPTSDLEYV